VLAPSLSMEFAGEAVYDVDGSKPTAKDEAAKGVVEEVEVEDDLATPLAGHWMCTSTFGLDEFLTKNGLGSFQRKLALAARWPNWDFKVEKGRIAFVNHSAMGDLHEQILLDGSKYTWKDGRSNILSCRAKWMKSADGGCLTIWRSHEQVGTYHEERRISGNTLTFTLFSQDGTTWGRAFDRAN